MPFDVRTDDQRVSLYLDRVGAALLEDLTLEVVVAELEHRQYVLTSGTSEIIARTIAAWRDPDQEDPTGVLIATGRLPEDGTDGYVEWAERCDPDRRRRVGNDGSVSHYESHLVTVDAGEVICTFHPPTEGERGVDVCNNELPARDGKPVPYRVGAGCHVDEGTGHVIAEVDGTLSTAQAEIRVTEGLHLQGNVDFETGHVGSPGDIQIDGSVVDLFKVDGGSNVSIRNDVSLAEVRAIGDLDVGGAIATGDKGACLAGGDIRVRLIKASTVAAWGSIEIDKEAISAALFAGKAVNAPHATLAGGVIAGLGGVTAKVLGSDGEVSTLVLAGVDWAIDRLTLPVLAEIRKLTDDIEKRMSVLNILRASLKRLSQAQREELVELVREIQTLQEKIDERTAFIEAVRAKSNADIDPVVHVVSEIHPGVELRLVNRLTKIATHMRGPVTFTLADVDEDKQIVAKTASGNTVAMKTGRIAEPLLKIPLPEIPPLPQAEPEPAAETVEDDA